MAKGEFSVRLKVMVLAPCAATQSQMLTGVLKSEFRMDAEHGNAFAFGSSPAQPNAEQLKELQKAGQLEQTGVDHAIATKDGRANIELDVPRQGIVLVRLREE
jgi:xylan 1,4-beta-xylosidase